MEVTRGEHMPRYVVFDTETPNTNNNRICQIGLTVVENGAPGRTLVRLVDPECDYSWFNIQIHGITPEATNASPCFAELWHSELEQIFDGAVLVAHNAPFDMSVLASCLSSYCIEWRERAEYIDTVRMARRAFPELPNHKLDTLSRALNIDLMHHDALSDAMACARVFLECIRRGLRPEDYTRVYDLAARATLKGARRNG